MTRRQPLTSHHSPPMCCTASRAGKTLIEVAVVVSLMSVAMSMAAATLTTLFRVERQFSADFAQDVTLARLASRWRADAHEATEAEVDDGCKFTLPDGQTVHYAFSAPAIQREVRRGDQVEHRDAFVLPKRALATFSKLPDEDGRITRLAIASELSDGSPRTSFQATAIDGALNLHGQRAAKEGTP